MMKWYTYHYINGAHEIYQIEFTLPLPLWQRQLYDIKLTLSLPLPQQLNGCFIDNQLQPGEIRYLYQHSSFWISSRHLCFLIIPNYIQEVMYMFDLLVYDVIMQQNEPHMHTFHNLSNLCSQCHEWMPCVFERQPYSWSVSNTLRHPTLPHVDERVQLNI